MRKPTAWRRVAATNLPAALPAVMMPVFKYTVRRFGDRRGYQAGFAVYWAACWGLAAAIAGPHRLVGLWRPASGPQPQPQRRPRALLWSVLIIPPAGAVATELIPNARKAGLPAALAAVGVGFTNAMAEEALWRGVPVAVFPGRKIRGWLWPSLWFTAWHLVPLSVRPHPRGRRPVLLGACLTGLGYGWAAQGSGSLLAVSIAHAATDSCGVLVARNVWLPTDND